MQHCSCLLLDLFTAQKYHIMVDLNVLSEVGGFKHYLAKDTLGLMASYGGAQAPKAPP